MERLSATDLATLERLCPGGLAINEDLSRLSQWRVGGPADLMLRPSSTREAATLCAFFAEHGITPLVIGSTTNLLFSDHGLRVPCIQIGTRMASLEIDGCNVRVEAGCWVPHFARRLMQAGLTGLEHIVGIPGTLGGLICMNGGSQRKCVGDHVVSVESVDAQGGICTRRQSDLNFSYRQSIFHNVDEIITGAELRLEYGNRSEIRREMLEILVSRSLKFPRKQPNCGSTFVSDPKLYAEHGPPGTIIEGLGFKGYRVGGAEVSRRHANFLVNTGGASAKDILALIRDINIAVERQTGRTLLAEVRFVHPDGSTAPASDIARTLEGTPA